MESGDPGPLAWTCATFRRFGVQISWPAQHFGSPMCTFRGRRSTSQGQFIDLMAGVAFVRFWRGRVANAIGANACAGACRSGTDALTCSSLQMRGLALQPATLRHG